MKKIIILFLTLSLHGAQQSPKKQTALSSFIEGAKSGLYASAYISAASLAVGVGILQFFGYQSKKEFLATQQAIKELDEKIRVTELEINDQRQRKIIQETKNAITSNEELQRTLFPPDKNELQSLLENAKDGFLAPTEIEKQARDLILFGTTPSKELADTRNINIAYVFSSIDALHEKLGRNSCLSDPPGRYGTLSGVSDLTANKRGGFLDLYIDLLRVDVFTRENPSDVAIKNFLRSNKKEINSDDKHWLLYAIRQLFFGSPQFIHEDTWKSYNDALWFLIGHVSTADSLLAVQHNKISFNTNLFVKDSPARVKESKKIFKEKLATYNSWQTLAGLKAFFMTKKPSRFLSYDILQYIARYIRKAPHPTALPALESYYWTRDLEDPNSAFLYVEPTITFAEEKRIENGWRVTLYKELADEPCSIFSELTIPCGA